MEKIFKPNTLKSDSNEKVYYSYMKNKSTIEESIDPLTFISNLDKEDSYIFSKEVIIETKNNIYDTKIAGKNGNRIITMDSDIIPIKDIIKIKFK